MPVFKKHLTALTKGGDIQKHRGKGSQSGMLPGRSALNALTSNPGATTPNDYSKATPSIGGGPQLNDNSGPEGTGLGSGVSPGLGI